MISRKQRVLAGIFLALFATVAAAQFFGIPRRVFAFVVSNTLVVEGAFTAEDTLTVQGISDLQGTISNSISTVTIADTFQVSSTTTQFSLDETDAAADERRYRFSSAGGIFTFGTRTDANGAGANIITANRTGTTVDTLGLFATTITSTGNSVVTGTSDFQGNIFDSGGSLTFADNIVVTGTANFQGNVFNSLGRLTINDIIIIPSSAPEILFDETDAAANESIWSQQANSGQLNFLIRNDAESISTDWLTVDRTTTTVDTINLQATNVQVNGTNIGNIVRCDITFDPADLAAGLSQVSTQTCTGATTGAYCGAVRDATGNGLTTYCHVTSTNNITLTVGNHTNANVNLGSATYRIVIIP